MLQSQEHEEMSILYLMMKKNYLILHLFFRPNFPLLDVSVENYF